MDYNYKYLKLLWADLNDTPQNIGLILTPIV